MIELLKTVKKKLTSKYLKNDTPRKLSKINKKFKPRFKARLRKNKHLLSKNIDNFFDWIKGAELVELKECNIKEDPVRPELDNIFRTSHGRKIFGVKFKNEIHAVMCFAYTNEIPKSVDELDRLSQDAYLQSTLRGQNVGKIAIAYTVWSKKKGGGKLIVKEVFKKIKKSNHLNRLVTLSPLTDMAYKFHSKNGAKLVQVNENTQNFEYEVEKNNY
ncbi:hypothetical protein IDH20_03095 [Pelagibacterales bacterium SAG-MED39]|nr:hypothetical protein [Pelagibacterales bacterium SAG-MED39]